MRHFTLLLIGGLLSSGLAHGQQKAENRTFIGSRAHSEVMFQMPGSQNVPMKPTSQFNTRAGETAILKPYKEYGYEYNPALADPWVKTMEFTIDYDKKGNEIYYLSEESDGVYRTYTTYDENNMKTESITQEKDGDGETWLNLERRTYKFDKIVTDHVIEQSYYTWDPVNEDWKTGYSHKFDITRDAEGRVIKNTKLSLYQGEYEVLDYVDIAYGEDGKAKTYTLFELKGYEEDGTPILGESLKLDNIEWENTNGQILVTHEYLTLGENRLKKATRYDNGQITADITVTYTPGSRDFDELTIYANGEERKRQFLITLDDNGSYREEVQEFLDMDGDGKFTEDEIMYRGYMLEMCDENKNPISTEEFGSFEPEPEPEEMMSPSTRVEPEEGMERLGGTLTEYKYGENKEILELIMQGWNYEAGVYEPKMKKVSTDFRDVTTGLETTRTESGKLTYSVSTYGEMTFSMEGMNGYVIYSANGTSIVNAKTSGDTASESIANLPAGLYILKVTGTKGAETVKFLKR